MQNIGKTLTKLSIFLITIFIAFGLTNLVIFDKFWVDGRSRPSLLLVSLGATILSFFITKQNSLNATTQIPQLIFKICEFLFLFIFIVLIYWFSVNSPHYYKESVLLFLGLVFLLLFINLKLYINHRRSQNKPSDIKNSLVLGNGEYAQIFRDSINKNAWLGFQLIENPVSENSLDHISETIKKHNIKAVFISLDDIALNDYYKEKFRRISDYELVDFFTFSSVFSSKLLPSSYVLVDNIPFINIHSYPLKNFGTRLFKRLFDILSSLFVIIFVLSWLIPFIGILILIEDGLPIFYRQERLGYKGEPFKIIKFRTMRKDAEKMGPQLSKDDDPRITKIGKFLRKYRIDEFPQFLNVLVGEMSIVGPRPERDFFVKEIIKESPEYRKLHSVKPGITSLGQVYYGYAENVREMQHRLFYDLKYLNDYSFLMDIKIILLTIKVVLLGKGK